MCRASYSRSTLISLPPLVVVAARDKELSPLSYAVGAIDLLPLDFLDRFSMAGPHIWKHVPGKALLFLINTVAAAAPVFEGECSVSDVSCPRLATRVHKDGELTT